VTLRPATLAALAVALLAGCASDPYGRYPDSLYDVISDGTVESRADHVELLSEIVTYHDELGTPPPPGVLAELAWYRASLGDLDQVSRLLALEKKNYPESAKFVEAVERSILGPERDVKKEEEEKRKSDGTKKDGKGERP
jgi:hypothetical protein